MDELRRGEPIHVLIVEDNPGDVRLTQEALRDGGLDYTLHVASDGKEALDFLYQRGEYDGAPRPDIVLLDLNLPKLDGHGVLREIRKDPDLERLPVVMLTSSAAEEDVVLSYELQSNAYLTKPVAPDEFVDLIRSFEEFWLTTARLPPAP